MKNHLYDQSLTSLKRLPKNTWYKGDPIKQRRVFIRAQTFSSLPEARKDLSPKQLRGLLNQAHQLAEEFRNKETDLIEILRQLDATKAYRMTGYNSLFQFCVESLLLTEHQAYNYITVCRKCTEIPELMVALEDRRITVSKARRMASVISIENQKDWIDLAEKSSQRDLEKAVRARDPLPPARDHLQIISSTEVKLQATLDQSVNEKLLRVLELIPEKTHKRTSINQSLDQMCDLFLDKNDPVRKAKRAASRKVRQDLKKQKILSSACAQPVDSSEAFSRPSASDSPSNSNPHTNCDSNSNINSNLHSNSNYKSNSGSNSYPHSNSVCAQKSFSLQSAHSGDEDQSTRKRTSIPAKTKHLVWARDKGQCRFHQNGIRCKSTKYLQIHHRKPVSKAGEMSSKIWYWSVLVTIELFIFQIKDSFYGCWREKF